MKWSIVDGCRTKTIKKHRFELRYAICLDLIDLLPQITFANQTRRQAYKRAHKFIEVGWLIFHAKLSWWDLSQFMKEYADSLNIGG